MRKLASQLFLVIPVLFLLAMPAWGITFGDTKSLQDCKSLCTHFNNSCLFTKCEDCSLGTCRSCGAVGLLFCQAENLRCNLGCDITFAGGDISFPAQLDQNQRHILVNAPLDCPAGLDVKLLQITVSQRTTGAIAQGTTRGDCGDGPFSVVAHVLGETKFQAPSTVQICALAQLGRPSLDTDSKQWCSEGFLVPEGFELE